MVLKKREKILAIATGVLLVGIVGKLLLSFYGGDTSRLRATRDNLLAANAKARDQVRKAAQTEVKLAQWRKRALPSQHTGPLYQNWLLEIGDKVRFRNTKVEANEPRTLMDPTDRTPIYHRLSFNVHAQGTLEQLTQWLYEFYSAGYLHKIDTLSAKPTEGSRGLELAIAVEALVLPDPSRKNELPKDLRSLLAQPDLSKYRAAIVERNLFAPYSPPRPPEKKKDTPPPPPFDPSRYVYVTAIVEVDGKPQVWLEARTTGEKFHLRKGESFQIGGLRGTILDIDSRHIQSEMGGKHYLVALGESLHDAIEIP